MKTNGTWESTAIVSCSDNGQSKTAEVIKLQEGQRMVVSIDRSIRLEMVYNPRNKLYIANQSGLEFVSSGPKWIERTEVKRR
jgi:arylsulfatase A-like enzyme